MVIVKNQYAKWMVQRILKGIFSYILLFPVLVVLYPIAAASNWLGTLFYRWKF